MANKLKIINPTYVKLPGDDREILTGKVLLSGAKVNEYVELEKNTYQVTAVAATTSGTTPAFYLAGPISGEVGKRLRFDSTGAEDIEQFILAIVKR